MADLAHLDARGRARMIDVGGKPARPRRAVAEAFVRMRTETARMLADGALPKGDAAAVARVAGIMAAKRTHELLALCHPLPLDAITVDVEAEPGAGRVRVTASAAATARTGVEMEALTAVSVAALNVWDLVKGVDADLAIEGVRLLEKVTGPATEGPPPAG